MKRKKLTWLIILEVCLLAGLVAAAVWFTTNPDLLRQPEVTEPTVITTAPTTEPIWETTEPTGETLPPPSLDPVTRLSGIQWQRQLTALPKDLIRLITRNSTQLTKK